MRLHVMSFHSRLRQLIIINNSNTNYSSLSTVGILFDGGKKSSITKPTSVPQYSNQPNNFFLEAFTGHVWQLERYVEHLCRARSSIKAGVLHDSWYCAAHMPECNFDRVDLQFVGSGNVLIFTCMSQSEVLRHFDDGYQWGVTIVSVQHCIGVYQYASIRIAYAYVHVLIQLTNYLHCSISYIVLLEAEQLTD